MQGAPRNLVLAVTAIAACLCIAACGSSSSTTTTNSSGSSGTTTTAATGRSAGRAKLVACLKAHGVTLPSRPGGFRRGSGSGSGGPGSGGGFFGGGGGAGGGRFSNPKFAAAFKACGANFGGGGFAGGSRARFSAKTLATFTACVKKNGYTLPAPNTSGSGPVFPASIEKNAKFQAAAKSCESILRASFRGGPGGAGGAAAPPTS